MAVPPPPPGFELVPQEETTPAPPPGFELLPAGEKYRAPGLLNGESWESVGNRAWRDIKRAGRTVDDFVRGAADVLTIGLADEIAAKAEDLTGLGARGSAQPGASYEEQLAAQRATDAQGGNARLAGQLVGGITSGVGAARSGLTLLNMAKPTLGKLALAGAGEGALYGGAYGFGSGEGGLENRLMEAGKGAAIGGALGGIATPVLGKIAGATKKTGEPLTTEALKKEVDALYGAVDEAGLRINSERFSRDMIDLTAQLEKEGLDEVLHPNASRIAKLITDKVDEIGESGEGIAITELEKLRRKTKTLFSTQNKSEQRLASMITEKIDEMIEKGLDDMLIDQGTELRPIRNFVQDGMEQTEYRLAPRLRPAADQAAQQAGEPTAKETAQQALLKARALYGQTRKTEMVEDMISQATLKSETSDTLSLDKALRNEFRSLVLNKKKMRMFTPEEAKVIDSVAKRGLTSGTMSLIAALSPRSVLSATLSGLLGFTAGGPIGALGTLAAGEAARRISSARTLSAAQRAADTFRHSSMPFLRPETLANVTPQIGARRGFTGRIDPSLIEALLQTQAQRGTEIVLDDPGNRRRLQQGR